MGITRNTQLSLKAPTIRLKMQFYNISKVDYQNSRNLIWEKSLIVSVIWVSPIPRLDALVNWHRLALGGLRRIEIRLKCNNAHFKQRFFILRPRIPLSLFEKMIFSVLEERKCKRLWLGDFVNLALKYSIFLSKIMSRPANIKLQFIFVLEMNEWEWQLCHLKRRQSLAELWALCVHSARSSLESRECHSVTPHCTCCLHFSTNTLYTSTPLYRTGALTITNVWPAILLIVFKVIRQNTHRD